MIEGRRMKGGEIVLMILCNIAATVNSYWAARAMGLDPVHSVNVALVVLAFGVMLCGLKQKY